ncbi:LysE family translocator [Stella sp.]|uniref:LysE family translocator n=1 Tax=Stella sp. TaxID=2912054 RepID=UPI0035B0041D
MDLLPVLLHLSAIHILMAMIPGPNTVVVSYCSAAMSRGAGLRAAAGIGVATFVWVGLSLAGIGLLLAAAGDLYLALRLAGAAYLVHVGWRMLRAARRAAPDATGPRAGRAVPGARSPFLAGLATTLSNPKSAVFWTSVFALLVPADAPAWFLAAAVALVTVQSLVWYAAVALALSTPLARSHYRRLTAWLDRVAGVVMIALGLRLADEVRVELVARMP